MKWIALAVVAACHGRSAPAPSTSSTAPVSTAAPTVSSPSKALDEVVIDPRGIGFDDLGFADGFVLVPAGATGNLVLIRSDTRAMQTLHPVRFSNAPEYLRGRHDIGVTSVAAGYVVTNRSSKTLIDVQSGIGAYLASEPDYVRVVPHEVWVTEPDAAQIEVFTPMPFEHLLTFAVPDGPESLVVSISRNTAYSNLSFAKTVEIDIAKHAIVRTFESGCIRTRGIALDDAGGGLFVACNDGRVVRIDLTSGNVTAEGRAGDGVDIIDFSPKTKHLYVPAARTGTLTVFDAKLAVVQTAPVPKGAHCVVADDRDQAWICDPDHGSLVVFSENP